MSSEKNAALAKAQAVNSLILLNVQVRKLEKQTFTAPLLQNVTLLAAQTPQQLEAMVLTVVENPSEASKLAIQLKNIVDQLAFEERAIKDQADRLQATHNRLFGPPHGTFGPFPGLPIELRHKIWRYAASGCIIELYTDVHHEGWSIIKICKASTRSFYNIMAVCKEARDYLKSPTRYQTMTAGKLRIRTLAPDTLLTFNPQADTLFFNCTAQTLTEGLRIPAVAEIAAQFSTVAFNIKNTDAYASCFAFLSRFSQVKKVIISLNEISRPHAGHLVRFSDSKKTGVDTEVVDRIRKHLKGKVDALRLAESKRTGGLKDVEFALVNEEIVFPPVKLSVKIERILMMVSTSN